MASIAPAVSSGLLAPPEPLPRYVLRHGVMPVVGALVLSLPLMRLGGDTWWADRLYAGQGHVWALRSSFLLRTLLHDDMRKLVGGIWILLASTLAWDWRGAVSRRWHAPLRYVLIAMLTSVSLAALLKGVTHVDCPWDLARYGGAFGGRGLLDWHAVDPGPGRCFPAGHASAGYAWVALYFMCLAVKPAWRWSALALGLGLGLVFGVAQQLRGAHFLSHDLWALTVCWITSAMLARWLLPAMRTNGQGHAP
ncbi:MAG: phosphatase PAP2 family protein [Pseudoxanthomonas sp.]